MLQPRRRISIWLWQVVCLCLVLAGKADAQSVISVRPGLIHHVEGKVVIVDSVETAPDFGRLRHLEEAQLLRAIDGRAELMLDQGTFLRLGSSSEIEMVRADLSHVQVRLDHGSMLVEVRKKPTPGHVSVLAGGVLISFRKKGLYRIDDLDGQAPLLRVFRGRAVASTDEVEIEVASKYQMRLDEDAGEPGPSKFKRSEKDGFDRWNHDRIAALDEDERARHSHSARDSDSVFVGTGGMYGGSGGYGRRSPSPRSTSTSGGAASSSGASGGGLSADRGSGRGRVGGR